MNEGELRGPGPRIHYIEWLPAEDKPVGPPFLLFHGTSSNALYWTRMAHHLTGHRMVALDLRGHGHSEAPATGYTPETMAIDAAEAIIALDLDRPFVVGHSWGIAVALQLASQCPDLVSGLVLVDGPIAPLPPCITWEEAKREMLTPPSMFERIEDAEASWAAFLQDAWGDDLRAFVRSGLVRTPEGWVSTLPEAGRLEMLRSLYDSHPEELLPRTPGPVFVAMATDASDGVAPNVLACWRRNAEAVTRLCSRAELRTYASRHDIPLIMPAELAAEIERVALTAAA